MGTIGRKVESVNTMEKKKEDVTCTSNLASCKEKGVHRRRNKAFLVRLVMVHDLHWKIPYVELENGWETNTTISAERLGMDQGKESLQ